MKTIKELGIKVKHHEDGFEFDITEYKGKTDVKDVTMLSIHEIFGSMVNECMNMDIPTKDKEVTVANIVDVWSTKIQRKLTYDTMSSTLFEMMK